MSSAAALAWLSLLLVVKADGKPHLSEIQHSLEGGRVAVSFQLHDAFDERLWERIDSGLPSDFVYDIGLYRDRKRWWDKRIKGTTLQVVAMYNAVTREYLVNYKQDGELIDTRVVRDPRELEAAMTRFEDFEAFALNGFDGRPRLLVKARAELGSSTFLGIIPVKVGTGWAESEKFRPPQDPG